MNRSCKRTAITALTTSALADFPEYDSPTIYGRTGVTCLNMPDRSSISSPTISIDDARDVGVDVNFVGGTGNPGLFYATNESGTINGGIVYNAADIISGDPSLSGNQQALFAIGFDDDLFIYDDATATTAPLNYPLGVTGASGLTLDSAQRIGGRLDFGFDGDVYGTFLVQDSGFPTLQVYAADADVDVWYTCVVVVA